MAEVIVAAGSNLGDRIDYLRQAARHLAELSEQPLEKSSIWESEAVGPAEFPFLNSVAILHTTLEPRDLLKELKALEQTAGREPDPKRWGPRVLDLDIITYDDRVINEKDLVIPHPEYHQRSFVLLPIRDLRPDWRDPVSHWSLTDLIREAPEIEIEKTDLIW